MNADPNRSEPEPEQNRSIAKSIRYSGRNHGLPEPRNLSLYDRCCLALTSVVRMCSGIEDIVSRHGQNGGHSMILHACEPASVRGNQFFLAAVIFGLPNLYQPGPSANRVTDFFPSRCRIYTLISKWSVNICTVSSGFGTE